MTNELKGKVNYTVNGNIAILEVDNCLNSIVPSY